MRIRITSSPLRGIENDRRILLKTEGISSTSPWDGIGEHQPEVRTEAVSGLGFLGVAVDEGRNAAAEPDCDVSAPGAAVRTLVIAAREDIEIARQVRATLAP